MDEIISLRADIDKTDEKLIRYFEKRMELVKEIGLIKIQNFLEIEDSNREEEIIKNSVLKLNGEEFSEEIQEFLKCIIHISKKIQQKEKDRAIKLQNNENVSDIRTN